MRHSRPAAELAEAGQTPVAVAVNDQLRLLLGVADALRPDSPHGIRRLHGLGLETVLATGDTREAAATTARAGLRRYRHRRRRRPGAAMAAADITLVHAGIGAVANVVMLARATRTIIRQNLGWAFRLQPDTCPAGCGRRPAPRARRHGRQLGHRGRQRAAAAPLGKTGAGRRPTAAA